jgi:proteasome lid subunit RPN8/RPN11
MVAPIIITKPCFFTIAASCVEVYNKETAGFLLGSLGRGRRAVTLEAAYPLQTARRKPTEVRPGNVRAYKRAEAAIYSVDYRLVGEYHSHPEGSPALSRADLSYIQARDRLLRSRGVLTGRRRFLELVVAVRRQEYVSPRTRGWLVRSYASKVSARLAINGGGYRLTFGAYWLETAGPEARPIETEIRLPWWSG